jgi:tryptophan synthase alpha chain
MSRIDGIFAELRALGGRRGAIMPFITGGYPSLEITAQTIPALEQAGASICEIGFPFSDPIADGPVIASSMHEALKSGVTPRKIFETIKNTRVKTKLGLIAMVSDSIITRMGPERFVSDATSVGLDGLIVPDIDLEAARPLSGLTKLHGMSFTLLIAPTTTERRIAEIVSLCSGFVYVVARIGITGESKSLGTQSLRKRIEIIRSHTNLPLALGFGISTSEHVAQALKLADAAIIGSALVRRMTDAADPISAAREFVREVSHAAGKR